MDTRPLFALRLIIMLAAASAVFACMAGRVKAGEPPCFPVAAVQRAMTGLAQHGADITVLRGQEAKAYLAALNAYPPSSHVTGDGVVVVAIPEHGVMIWLLKGETACLAGKIGQDVNAKLMLAAHERSA